MLFTSVAEWRTTFVHSRIGQTLEDDVTQRHCASSIFNRNSLVIYNTLSQGRYHDWNPLGGANYGFSHATFLIVRLIVIAGYLRQLCWPFPAGMVGMQPGWWHDCPRCTFQIPVRHQRKGGTGRGIATARRGGGVGGHTKYVLKNLSKTREYVNRRREHQNPRGEGNKVHSPQKHVVFLHY